MDCTTRDEFRGKINGLAAQSAKLRRRIHRSKGEKRFNAWYAKRALGQRTRHLLLAYAYLRGVPYEKLEKKIAPDNAPDIHLLYLLVQETLDSYRRFDYKIEYAQWKLSDAPHKLSDIATWVTCKRPYDWTVGYINRIEEKHAKQPIKVVATKEQPKETLVSKLIARVMS